MPQNCGTNWSCIGRETACSSAATLESSTSWKGVLIGGLDIWYLFSLERGCLERSLDRTRISRGLYMGLERGLERWRLSRLLKGVLIGGLDIWYLFSLERGVLIGVLIGRTFPELWKGVLKGVLKGGAYPDS